MNIKDTFSGVKKRNLQVGTSLKTDTYDKIAEIALANELSVSEVIRTIIEKFVAEWEDTI